MNTSYSVIAVVFGLAGCGLLYVWSAGAKTGRKVERQIRRVSRFGEVVSASVVAGVVIAGIQWAVIAHTTHPGVLAGVLGLPAVLAGATVGRLFTVTTYHRRGERTSPGGARRTARKGGRR